MKKLVLLSLIFGLFSCASRNYYQTDKWKQNNTITIKSENLNEFSICIDGENIDTKKVDESNIEITKYKKNNPPDDPKRLITVNSTSGFYNLTFDGFKKKDIKVSLLNKNYEKIDLTIQKRVRYDALAKDVGLSLITYGIPLIVDVFKSDFYKLKKSSKNHVVRFEYLQSYMLDEYKKIANSMNPKDFNDWLAKYPKSSAKQTAINRKDSVELIIALSKGQEAAIDEYILAHKSSVFLNEAEGVKKEMVLARELFTSACQKNSVEAYEDFLSKYPKSLHNKEVQKLLLNAAEREAIATSSSEKMILFIKNYFIPNINLIEIIETNKFSAREKKIKNSLEDFIIKEALQNNQDNKYENYRLLWSKYSAICKDNNIPSVLKNFDKIKKYQVEICDYLFNKLKDANTIEKQSIWIQKTLDDFPELELNDNFPAKSNDILLTIIETQTNGTGKILVFNSNILSQIPRNSKIDNGLIAKYNYGKYEYQGKTLDALATCNNQELNFAKGILSGINKAYKDKQLQYSIDANKNNEITDEISYYKDGKLVKTIFVSKECTSDGNCIVNKDFFYEFENGENITLKKLDQELSILKGSINATNYDEVIYKLNQLKKTKIPINLPQYKLIEELLNSAINIKWRTEKQIREDAEKIKLQNLKNVVSNYTWILKEGNIAVALNFEPLFDNGVASNFGGAVQWGNILKCFVAYSYEISGNKIKLLLAKDGCGGSSNQTLYYDSNEDYLFTLWGSEKQIYYPHSKTRP